MKVYTLTAGRILKGGEFIEAGGTVRLDDADAERLRESGCVLALAEQPATLPPKPERQAEDAAPAAPKRRRRKPAAEATGED